MTRGLGLVLVFCAAACGTDLTVPQGAVIRCDDDTECPENLRCQIAAGTCVDAAVIDVTGPTLLSAFALAPTAFVLTFDEPLDATVTADVSHYEAEPPLAIDNATPGEDGTSVVVLVERQDDIRYNVTVAGLFDVAGNPLATSTAAFDGIAPTSDLSAPTLLTPRAGQLLRDATTVDLEWSSVSGATRYIVDVATSNVPDTGRLPALREAIPGSPFIIQPTRTNGVPATRITVALPRAESFYWQVRADVTSGTPQPSRFDVLGDQLYVYCAPTDTCTYDAGAGTPNVPFESISRAIDEARLRGITRVNIAARGSGVAYAERIVLADGVALYGGYSADFATRAPAINVTAVAASQSSTVLGVNLLLPMTLDGLVLRGGAGQAVYTIQLESVASLVMNDVAVDGGTATDSSVAVNIQNRVRRNEDALSTVALTRCSLSASTAKTNSIGLRASNVALVISDSTITAAGLTGYGTESASGGVSVDGRLELRDSTVTSGAADTSYAVAIGISDAVDPTKHVSRIEHNTLRAASATTTAVGLRINQTSIAVLNNVIVAAGSNFSNGMSLTANVVEQTIVGNVIGAGPSVASYSGAIVSSLSVIANNVIFTRDSASPCIYPAYGSPRRVESNLYFGCTNAIADFDETPYDVNDCSTYPDPPLACRDNITSGSAQSFFVNFAAGDYRLKTSAPANVRFGGVNASTATYGSVTDDLDHTARTCPTPVTACFSMGAYERD